MYALKAQRKAQLVASSQVEHVNSELALLGSCCHPFLLRLVGAFQDRRSLFMIVELVLGGELFMLHQSERRFSLEATRFYAANVLCGGRTPASAPASTPLAPLSSHLTLIRLPSPSSPRLLGAPSVSVPQLARHRLPRPQAGKPTHRPGWLPQGHRLWLCKGAEGRRHLHFLRHARLHVRRAAAAAGEAGPARGGSRLRIRSTSPRELPPTPPLLTTATTCAPLRPRPKH
jgi:hypothetical protein